MSAAFLVPAGGAPCRVRGADAAGFLHNMLTQDVKGLAPGRAAPAAMTDRMAKTVASLGLARVDDGFLLLFDGDGMAAALPKLKVFVFASDVAFDDAPGLAWAGLEGPDAGAALAAAGLPSPEAGAVTAADGGWVAAVFPGRFELVAPPEVADRWRSALARAGAAEADEAAARALRVAAGRARFGVDYDGAFMPPEVGLQDAVNYHKGCYVGQEILERLRSRGKVTKRLRVLVFEADADCAGLDSAPVLAGDKEIGRATSFARDPGRDRWLALASLPAAKAAPGDLVAVEGRGARVEAIPAEAAADPDPPAGAAP